MNLEDIKNDFDRYEDYFGLTAEQIEWLIEQVEKYEIGDGHHEMVLHMEV